MKKKNKNEKNFFELIPIRNQKIGYQSTEENLVQLIIYRDGWFNKLVRKFVKTPDKIYIDLDEIGSFVWNCIDGDKNVFEISTMMKDNFGQTVEPVNERLVTYIKILKNNNFIHLM